MEVAVVAIVFAVGNILFGHFEAQTPKWRRLLKFLVILGLTLGLSATLGRRWAFLFLGLLGLVAVVVHGWWLPWRHGINGWTGEPKEKYYALRGWKYPASSNRPPLLISVMVAVPDAPAAVAWYKRALGAVELWNLGSVVGLEVAGAPFFVGQPEQNGWESPGRLGITTTRIEVFCDDPDAFIARAIAAGANGAVDRIRNHEMPWGPHRQGGFLDPFGHMWLVGDRSPLSPHPETGSR